MGEVYGCEGKCKTGMIHFLFIVILTVQLTIRVGSGSRMIKAQYDVTGYVRMESGVERG